MRVHRVARLEPWILVHREGTFDDLLAGVDGEARRAAADPNCVAFKSIVAYRTGLDVGDPSEADAREAFAAWRGQEWRETRDHAKPVRDFLIRRTLAVAKELGRAFHFHCGGGDPDIDLIHAKPENLFPLLVDVQDQPVVLVHSGYPWIRESAYIASVLPNVYLELSELIPWGFGQVEWALEMLVGNGAGGQAPVRLRRGGGAGVVLDLGAARAAGARTGPGQVRRARLRGHQARRAARRDGARRQLPRAARPDRVSHHRAEGQYFAKWPRYCSASSIAP